MRATGTKAQAGAEPISPAFRAEFLDFDRGIRMGHLEPNERITQILKAFLADRHGIRFIIDRGYYNHWFFNPFCKAIRTIPVSGDAGAKEAIVRGREAVASGEVLGMFPEGMVTRTGALLRQHGTEAEVLGHSIEDGSKVKCVFHLALEP